MKLKVLLADDDETALFLQKRVVIKSGLSSEPISFKDGQAAFDYLNEQHQPDNLYLILLDINMPKMNGWEFLNAIQPLSIIKNIFVVMITSSISRKDRERAYQYLQVIGYVEKPLNLEICNQLKQEPQISGLF